MAVNPLIALQQTTPDIGQTFSNALMNIERVRATGQAREEAPARKQLLEAQAGSAETTAASQAELGRATSVVNAAVQINALPTTKDKLNFAVNRRDRLIEEGKRTGRPVNTEDTDLYISKLQSGDEVGAEQLIQGTINSGRTLGILGPAGGKVGLASAKTDILESGATIQALPSGDTVVRDPSGNIATGQARLDVLAEAKRQESAVLQERADITVETASRVEQVKKATVTADKAFGMVDKIRNNITNLREVIPLVGEGANTGPIKSRFPSFKKETVKLEALQKRLALDVVGAVTFGALSKGELDLARAVALPVELEGDALIQWVNDSIAAKEKLANYYEEQAIFLGQGNTQSDWLQFKKEELETILGDATEVDIRQTMKDNNMTRPQVLDELRRRNVSGGA